MEKSVSGVNFEFMKQSVISKDNLLLEEHMNCLVYKAASEGDVGFLKNLSSSPKDGILLGTTHQGNNVIHVAAKLGMESFISEVLWNHSFLACQKNSRGDTPLHVAARAGHINVVKLLVPTKEIRVNSFHSTVTPIFNCLKETEEGNTGYLELLKISNDVGSTALHEALRNGHESVAEYLWGFDHNVAAFVTSAGESILYLAAESRCKVMVRKILNFLEEQSNKPNLLHNAVQGPDGQNPLHASVIAGSSECIDLLLGLEEILELINQPDNNGKTALHFATAATEIKIMTQLLNKNTSSAYLRDKSGRTPLLEAAISGNLYVLQELLKHCPDTIEICDPAGRNALHLAVLNNTVYNVWSFLHLPKMIELINEPDKEGNTPLHLATKNQNYKMVKKLIKTKRVDLRAKNSRGLTALDICESDSKLSYRQRFLHDYLSVHNAPRGRHPYNQNLFYSETKSAFDHPGVDLKQIANTLSVVAALLATLTFTAAFTLPGGYHADDESNEKEFDDGNKNRLGASILIAKASLKAFVLADSVSLCCSMTVVFLLILAMAGDPAFLRSAIKYSKNLLNIALGGTLVAFMTGLYTVISPKCQWVANTVIAIGSSVPFLIKYLRRKSSTSTPRAKRWLMGTVKNPVLCYNHGRTSEYPTPGHDY